MVEAEAELRTSGGPETGIDMIAAHISYSNFILMWSGSLWRLESFGSGTRNTRLRLTAERSLRWWLRKAPIFVLRLDRPNVRSLIPVKLALPNHQTIINSRSGFRSSMGWSARNCRWRKVGTQGTGWVSPSRISKTANFDTSPIGHILTTSHQGY